MTISGHFEFKVAMYHEEAQNGPIGSVTFQVPEAVSNVRGVVDKALKEVVGIRAHVREDNPHAVDVAGKRRKKIALGKAVKNLYRKPHPMTSDTVREVEHRRGSMDRTFLILTSDEDTSSDDGTRTSKVEGKGKGENENEDEHEEGEDIPLDDPEGDWNDLKNDLAAVEKQWSDWLEDGAPIPDDEAPDPLHERYLQQAALVHQQEELEKNCLHMELQFYRESNMPLAITFSALANFGMGNDDINYECICHECTIARYRGLKGGNRKPKAKYVARSLTAVNDVIANNFYLNSFYGGLYFDEAGVNVQQVNDDEGIQQRLRGLNVAG